MFATLLVAILSGIQVAFALGAVGIVFGCIGHMAGVFLISDFGFVPQRIYGVMQNTTLIAVPLFIFMGITLERSGIAADLLQSMERVFWNFRGGLPISLILVGALLAASTGIVGATVVTMGVLSLPTIIKRGYPKELACGAIAASGTLGQIIPPSIVLILIASMMNIAVADLFAAALIPGGMLVALYIVFCFLKQPSAKSTFKEEPNLSGKKGVLPDLLKSVLPPLSLIAIVLGTILGGMASPTEAAACGAVGAVVLALLKRKLTTEKVRKIASQTTAITSMVFTLLIGAQFFGVVFRGLDGEELIANFLFAFGSNQSVILLVIMLMLFVLGFFLDFLEICFIVIPIIAPILVGELGINPVWLAILIAMNLQTSFLTPPFGFALFYLKGVAPAEISSLDIYRGVIPFIAIQLGVLFLVWAFPQLALWLPALLFPQ